MIDPHRTGAAISRLRRERDWTQVELAEKLHVTHQAVSRWETGDSFPDIAALHTLGQLFGVGVDELLAGHQPAEARERPSAAAAVLDELAQGNTRRVSEMVQDGRADLESVTDIGPLVRPSQMEDIVRGLSNTTDYAFSLEQVAALAPFVGSELLEELVEGIEGGHVDGGYLVALAPFLPRATVDRLVGRIAGGELEVAHLAGLAPFASKEAIGRIALQIVEGGGQVPAEHLGALAPFVGQEALNALVERVEGDGVSAEHLGALAPFLGRETLKRLVARLPKGRAGANTLAALAPFLDQETLASLIREHIAQGVKSRE